MHAHTHTLSLYAHTLTAHLEVVFMRVFPAVAGEGPALELVQPVWVQTHRV